MRLLLVALLVGGCGGAGAGLSPSPEACTLREIPDPFRDVWWTRTELVGLVDGLPSVSMDGKRQDHPIALAQWGLRYQYTNDLPAMRRVADELVSISEVRGDARLYMYSFDFEWAGQPLKAPWFSGMAQGQVLSVMVRLAEATGEERYATLADETFRGLLLATTDGWIEEYPVPKPDPVLNGHALAALGLYDYWRFTGKGKDELCRAIDTLADFIAADPERAVWYDRDGTMKLSPDDVYRQIHQLAFDALAEIRGSTVLVDAAVRQTAPN